MSGNGEDTHALLTDFYQLTMAYGYWKAGKSNDDAVFNLFFRRAPFRGGYVISAGLEQVVDYIRHYSFSRRELYYLESLQSSSRHDIFDSEFLDYLKELRLSCDIDALPEGMAAFPGEPMLQVRGPLLQCQLLESALLNIVNYQSLIATKAARICVAARGPVVEFGLRRAPGPNGAMSASRAAYIGGCVGTSNVLAGQRFGIPVKGTHGHSWVMAFDSEAESFDAFAAAQPDDCILLVDTYDTPAGIEHAARVGEAMRRRGLRLAGIRLDSGDLAVLSRQAREILDRHGLIDCRIVAGNELDEYEITRLRRAGAAIDLWGVGTRLVTGCGDSALSGVYKMSAMRSPGGDWSYKLKVTSDPDKMTCGGMPRIRRYTVNNLYWGDMIYDEQLGAGDKMILPDDTTVAIPGESSGEDLLLPIFRNGKLVYELPRLERIRERTVSELCRLPEELLVPEPSVVYPVGRDGSCLALNRRLSMKYRSGNANPA
ncbi:MAG: nicotinate phosphoribosyltransferase [Victivallales bacterium]|nr:nicotinate phosphoribosyltransferase [Victivallales bacterium]